MSFRDHINAAKEMHAEHGIGILWCAHALNAHDGDKDKAFKTLQYGKDNPIVLLSRLRDLERRLEGFIQGHTIYMCTKCGEAITGGMVGTGDGSGQRFQHISCFKQPKKPRPLDVVTRKDSDCSLPSQERTFVKEEP